jgi:hypothetical protein
VGAAVAVEVVLVLIGCTDGVEVVLVFVGAFGFSVPFETLLVGLLVVLLLLSDDVESLVLAVGDIVRALLMLLGETVGVDELVVVVVAGAAVVVVIRTGHVKTGMLSSLSF